MGVVSIACMDSRSTYSVISGSTFASKTDVDLVHSCSITCSTCNRLYYYTPSLEQPQQISILRLPFEDILVNPYLLDN